MFERLIAFHAKYRPDDIAISTMAGQATFESFNADIDQLAAALQPTAPQAAHVIVQVAAVGLHWALLMALARLGCISTSLPQVGERSQAELLAILRPDLLITDAEAAQQPLQVLYLTPQWLQNCFSTPSAPVTPHAFAPDDPVRIVLSSGATGTPKKMAFTRRIVDARIRTGGLSVMGRRRLHSVVGLDSETGFRAPLVAWASGLPVLYPEAGFQWSEFLVRSRPQVLVLVPAQLETIVSGLPMNFPVQPHLTLVLVSGSLPAALYERTQTLLTPNIYVTYGSTEAGLACQLSPHLRRNVGVVTGVISPSAEVEVVDENGAVLPPGSSGRIRVRTEEMVQGYLDAPELTARFFRDGWFYPGDLGFLDGSGRLTIQGRESELLDLGGVRLAPDAIEDLLLSCPGVKDAAAFSVLGRDGVHRARAAVVTDATFRLEATRTRLSQSLPQIDVEVQLVRTIPRSDRGKIMRRDLVDPAAATDPEAS